MAKEKDLGGRPSLSDEEKRIMLQKLEPYLKVGLSTRKALLESGVPSSTFYRLMEEDEGFREQIELYKQFTSVLLNNALVTELQAIIKKQTGYEDKKGKKVRAERLNKAELEFLWKFALNSNSTKGEFGERKDVNLFDAEAEIQKVKGLIADNTSKELGPKPNDD